MHFVFDTKGNSIWFNPVYMESWKRNETEFLSLNYVEMLLTWNRDHPYTEVFLNHLQDRPEISKSKKK